MSDFVTQVLVAFIINLAAALLIYSQTDWVQQLKVRSPKLLLIVSGGLIFLAAGFLYLIKNPITIPTFPSISLAPLFREYNYLFASLNIFVVVLMFKLSVSPSRIYSYYAEVTLVSIAIVILNQIQLVSQFSSATLTLEASQSALKVFILLILIIFLLILGIVGVRVESLLSATNKKFRHLFLQLASLIGLTIASYLFFKT